MMEFLEFLITFGFFVGGMILGLLLCYFIDWGYIIGISMTIAIFSFVFMMMILGSVLMLCGIPLGNTLVEQPLSDYIGMTVIGFAMGTMLSNPFHFSRE